MNGQSHILTVLIPDRPGIIAAITSALMAHGVDPLELSQTVVRDYFTIILVLNLPRDDEADALLSEIETTLGPEATVTLVPYRESARTETHGERYVLTATGANSPGIVHTMAAMVANRGGNFSDLSTRVTDDEISIIAEIEVPHSVRIDQLQIDLQHAGAESGLRVRLQHHRLFVATNEVAFRRISNDS